MATAGKEQAKGRLIHNHLTRRVAFFNIRMNPHQRSNYRGDRGDPPPLRLWTPCNTRRRSLGAFGASPEVHMVAARSRLRSADHGDLVVPRALTTRFSSRSFRIAGPSTWNGLPSNIRSVSTREQFKRSLKSWLFE